MELLIGRAPPSELLAVEFGRTKTKVVEVSVTVDVEFWATDPVPVGPALCIVAFHPAEIFGPVKIPPVLPGKGPRPDPVVTAFIAVVTDVPLRVTVVVPKMAVSGALMPLNNDASDSSTNQTETDSEPETEVCVA